MGLLNLLLDTHVLLWWLANDAQLSKRARSAIVEADKIYVSAASVWEIAIKSASGKLRAPADLEGLMASNGFLELPISIAHASAAGKLPRLHPDPFDRMLVAQAQIESLTLLTNDRALKAYGGQIMLA
ncbi:MAG TPA: type II toxin-antitoxin system VapC family toxin [Bryobacteraceae bacterium]|jgi:PIN domain nuclease of toxin-antitoxin system|nr:type II toxin-antitoxin system VapC family toxin [Bryobacteraceae bacterium]